MSEDTTPQPERERCGHPLKRCAECSNPVAWKLWSQGKSCPKHPEASLVDGTCRNSKGCGIHLASGARGKTRATYQRRALEVVKKSAGVKKAGPVEDVLGELLQVAGDSVALKNALRKRVHKLEEFAYSGGQGVGEQIKGELQAYLTALQRCESILAGLLKLDLEARRVKLEEQKTKKMAVIIERVLIRAGLDPKEPDVRSLIAGEITRYEEGKGFYVKPKKRVIDVTS